MNNSNAASLYTSKSIAVAIFISIVYLALSLLLIGFKTDQLFLVFIFNTSYFFSAQSRKFIIGFSIFICYWIIFDFMKAFPNYQFTRVHIADLYNAEKSVFGIALNGEIVTPNEYWLNKPSVFLVMLSGIFYLCWIPVPLAFACYLFLKDKKLFLHFSLTFVLINLIGFIIYYTYPAAPPWYFQQHGSIFIKGTPGNTAGLIKFDQYTGVPIFKSIYAKSSNVFAAMPSLHAAYPLVVLYYAFKKNVSTLFKIALSIVALGIWFAAVYTSHHYLLDVIAGIICTIIGIVIFKKVLLSAAWFQRFIDSFLLKIV
jgi:membrane-associated phospholipid phosphatase